MKLAIMQPYFMPYIGYFQLINAVDKFVIYNDVNYIKQGWINRNNILLSEKAFPFTIPLENASSFKKIKDIQINIKIYSFWREKFLKSLQQSYKSSPNYLNVYSIIENLLYQNYNYICELNVAAILEICKICKIETEIYVSSTIYQNSYLKAEERIIDICRQEGATTYINPIGGQLLYKKESFFERKIQLQFLNTLPIHYKQKSNEFVSNLSIIDLLMFIDHREISNFLNQYELI